MLGVTLYLQGREITSLNNRIVVNVNPIIEETIAKKLLAEREEREPSGRLSASRLGWPLQWQILHHLKVEPSPIDEYTLRKFQRGKDVEDRIIAWMEPRDEQTQVECDYRGVVGYCDLLLQYPIEIKSVTNRAFSYIQKEGVKRGHKLQGELYAKALGFDTFGVAYVASDDYRVLTFEETVTDEVDQVIDRYNKQLELKQVPVFEKEEVWQDNPMYSTYPEWTRLSREQIDEKLKELNITF